MLKTFFSNLLVAGSIALCAHAEELPKATGFVNDYAHVLSPGVGAQLNSELAGLKDKTGVEVAVVTIPTLHGEPIASYARNLGSQWGIGSETKNNGILFLVDIQEHEMRIQTARGSREQLTDEVADEIRDKEILPAFRAGNMQEGVISGTRAIEHVFDSSVNATPPKDQTTSIPITTRERTSNEGADVEPQDWMYFCATLGCVALMFILMWIIILHIVRAQNRSYVRNVKTRVQNLLNEAAGLVRNPDTAEERKTSLETLQTHFSSFQNPSSALKASWEEKANELDTIEIQVMSLISRIHQDIRRATQEREKAEKAKKEVPELLKQIPELLQKAEEKLAQGTPSKRAQAALRKARKQYAKAQSMYTGDTSSLNWILLLILLNNAQDNCALAEQQHLPISDDLSFSRSESPSSLSDSTSLSPSFGFGDSGGFGGGGFDGGGGSTGNW